MLLALASMVLAGALLCNAIPHLVSGVRGERFYTPWAWRRGRGKSSALENFLWGAVNLLVGLALFDRYEAAAYPLGWIALVAGFLIAGTLLSIIFARRNTG